MGERYHIRLEGFEPTVQDPADGICKAFGVDRARAHKILGRIPAVVKKDAERTKAANYLRALRKIGARVVAVHTETGGVYETLEAEAPRALPIGSPRMRGEDEDAGQTVFGLPGRHEPPAAEAEHRAPSSTDGIPSGLRDPFRVLREPDLLQLERMMAGVEDGRFDASPAATDPFGKLASDALKAPGSDVFGRPETSMRRRETEAGPSGAPSAAADPFGFAGFPGGSSAQPAQARRTGSGGRLSNLVDEVYGDASGGTGRRQSHGSSPSSARQSRASLPAQVDWSEDPADALAREDARWAPPASRQTPAEQLRSVPSALDRNLASGPSTPQPRHRPTERSREHVRALASGAYAIATPAQRPYAPEPLPQPPPMPGALKQIDPFEQSGWQPLLAPAAPGSSLQGPPPERGLPEETPGHDHEVAPSTGAVRRPPRRPLPEGAPATYAEAATPERRIAQEQASRSREARSIVIVAVSVVVVCAAIFVGVQIAGGGGLDDAERAMLGQQSSQFLPGFAMDNDWAGQIAGGATTTVRANMDAGVCYGWTAATRDGASCNLDLSVAVGNQAVAVDRAADHYPAVFYCPTEAQTGIVEVRNSSGERCRYALGSYTRTSSAALPLDPYPVLYSRAFAKDLEGEPPTALGDVQRGTLPPGGEDTRSVTIPAGGCRTIIGVAHPGNDLAASIRFDDEVQSLDTMPDHYPVVSACAGERASTAEVRFSMSAGSGDYVWQIFDGQVETAGTVAD